MNAAYYEFQYQNDQGYAGVSSVLGDIDQDFYIGIQQLNICLKSEVFWTCGVECQLILAKNNPRSFLIIIIIFLP